MRRLQGRRSTASDGAVGPNGKKNDWQAAIIEKSDGADRCGLRSLERRSSGILYFD
jgi:hypothetical protein